MDDAEIERLRARNRVKIAARAIDACAYDNPDTDAELEILLNGPHAKAVALAILESPIATRAALKRRVRLWLPFGSEESLLLYELIADRSFAGVTRVKNLLDAGWDPNRAVPGTQRTALMQVATAWNPVNRDLVALLLAAGANVELCSVGGQTALDYAPLAMRNFIRSFLMDMDQDTTNRTGTRKDRTTA
jgi:hypothetical protein